VTDAGVSRPPSCLARWPCGWELPICSAPEAKLSTPYRAAQDARSERTVLTNVYTGPVGRSVTNRIARELGPTSTKSPDFPLAGAFVSTHDDRRIGRIGRFHVALGGARDAAWPVLARRGTDTAAGTEGHGSSRRTIVNRRATLALTQSRCSSARLGWQGSGSLPCGIRRFGLSHLPGSSSIT
jgi:hypothetical protein